MADELVSFDAKHEAIFKNLLATTAIFDTVEHARDAARKVRYQVRMVTLDGTAVSYTHLDVYKRQVSLRRRLVVARKTVRNRP